MSARRRRALCAALVSCLSLLAAPAAAHPLAPALLVLRESEAGSVDVEWRVPLLSVRGAPRSAVLPAGCPVADDGAWSEQATSFVRRWRIDCAPEGLVGRRIRVDGLRESGTDALLRVTLQDGRQLEQLLRPSAPEWVVPAGEIPRGAAARLWRFARLGVEHIATGADHLLFLLGLLLLVQGHWSLLKTVSAFTLGHSLTLALATLGWLPVPAALAELAIAASLFVLAVELTREPAGRGRLARRPWRAAGLFGLLHGLGFAGALREVGLPPDAIPLALAGFNLGIEVGQLAFVAAALGAGWLVLRLPLRAPPGRLRAFGVYTLGTLAAYWCWVRGFALFA